MAVDLSNAFDQLAEPDYWTDVALAFAGFMGALTLRAVVEGTTDFDLPDAVYGIGVGGLGAAMDYPMVGLGGGVYAVDSVASRTGIKGTVLSAVGGN